MKQVLRFLWNDLKKDLKTIKAIFKGEARLNFPEHIVWGDMFKENWLFFLILLLAFCSGWFVASQYYAHKSAMIIQEALHNLSIIYNQCHLTEPVNMIFH